MVSIGLRTLMRRSLVLTDESARHPFRASLPPHVRASVKPEKEKPSWAMTAADWRDFLSAYCACFLAVSTFIY